jgi:hypothetical protein
MLNPLAEYGKVIDDCGFTQAVPVTSVWSQPRKMPPQVYER